MAGLNLLYRKYRLFILLWLFVPHSHVCTAPGIDLHLKFARFRNLYDLVDRKYKEVEFSRFISALGKMESGNNWLSVNTIGCFGEWQFAESTLHFLGHKNITLRKFKSDPDIFPRELQQRVLESLIKVNLNYLRGYEHFIGDTIRGIVITKSGMVAASHLGGAGSLQLFLKSGGRVNKEDVLGTSILDYLKKFACYHF